jgi:hypothetical protein
MERDDVVKVPLGRYGDKGYALVDAERAAEVLAYCWSLNDKGYASRKTSVRSGGVSRKTSIRLHRQLLGLVPGDGVEGDHINGDRLDNRLANLRIVPLGANAQNKNFCTVGTSRFRGVSWQKNKRGRGAWKAQVQLDGKKYHLGCFQSELAAAQVVEAFRLEHMPFAEPEPELLRFYEEQHAC